MKKLIKYCLMDSKNKLYWESNSHYGYGPGNKRVLKSHFTQDISHIPLMSKKECLKIMELYNQFDFIFDKSIEINLTDLKIKKLIIHYSVEDV